MIFIALTTTVSRRFWEIFYITLLLFSISVMSDSLWPHELQQARLQSLLRLISIELVMSSDLLIFSCPLLLLPSVFPSVRVFSSELALHIRWPKYWSFSFSISPSNWHSGLISFKIDWSPCSPRNSQGSSLASQFENINSLALSLLYGSALTSTHDYWKDHNFDWMDLCRQGDVSAF